jgi:hypothetical protein
VTPVAVKVYVICCADGGVHGGEERFPRWLFHKPGDATEDSSMLDKWGHLKCGPHRVITLRGEAMPQPSGQ